VLLAALVLLAKSSEPIGPASAQSEPGRLQRGGVQVSGSHVVDRVAARRRACTIPLRNKKGCVGVCPSWPCHAGTRTAPAVRSGPALQTSLPRLHAKGGQRQDPRCPPEARDEQRMRAHVQGKQALLVRQRACMQGARSLAVPVIQGGQLSTMSGPDTAGLPERPAWKLQNCPALARAQCGRLRLRPPRRPRRGASSCSAAARAPAHERDREVPPSLPGEAVSTQAGRHLGAILFSLPPPATPTLPGHTAPAAPAHAETAAPDLPRSATPLLNSLSSTR